MIEFILLMLSVILVSQNCDTNPVPEIRTHVLEFISDTKSEYQKIEEQKGTIR